MKKLKVYGGNSFVEHEQVRMIVATTSWKRASELTGVSMSRLNGYWSITGNPTELEIATETPETVFYIPLNESWGNKQDTKNWKRFEGN